MFVDIVSGKDGHSLICSQVILLLHHSSLIIFLIWIFRTIKKVILKHFLIMNWFRWIQKYYRRLFNLLYVASMTLLLNVFDDITKGLNTIESSACFKHQVKTSFTTKIFWFTFDCHCNFFCRYLLQIFYQSIESIAIAWFIFFNQNPISQLFQSLLCIR